MALVLVAMLVPRLFWTQEAPGLSEFLWRQQDWPVVAALLALLLMLRRLTGGRVLALQLSTLAIAAAAVAVAMVAWAGHYGLFAGYNLSRDEQMVLFDSQILTRGQWFAVLPPEWAGLGDALNREFTLPLANPAAWVSAYLPGNAALHAGFAALGDPHMTAPVLAAIAVLALADIARRIWPGDAPPQAVTLICLLLSGQFLLTAMTTYAMTAHLALNLLWLALFLRDRPWGYALALLVGFVATGLHQPIFHPLFVAPFLLWLIEQRRWRLLAVLVTGYAAIGLFWLAWPMMITATANAGAALATTPAGADYVTRLIDTLGGWKPHGLWLMALNLLRFAAWQHLLLLPLAVLGVAAGWRANGLVRALTIGPILTIAAMLILLPYQGHGWGYRYLHGLIGNFCLLAGFGWLALRDHGWDSRRLIVSSTVVTLAAMLWLANGARAMVAPYAAVDRQIAAMTADFVIIDDRAAPFAQDLVYNPPYLDRRPVRLAGGRLPLADPQAALWQCKASTVALVGPAQLSAINRFFGQPQPPLSWSMDKARDGLQMLGCRVVAR